MNMSLVTFPYLYGPVYAIVYVQYLHTIGNCKHQVVSDVLAMINILLHFLFILQVLKWNISTPIYGDL